MFSGFMGVYLAGYILETTNSWVAVFQTTAAINMFGCVVFLVFGSGNAIVWVRNTFFCTWKMVRYVWSADGILKKITIFTNTFCRQRNITVLNLNYYYPSHLIHLVFQIDIWQLVYVSLEKGVIVDWISEFGAKIIRHFYNLFRVLIMNVVEGEISWPAEWLLGFQGFFSI